MMDAAVESLRVLVAAHSHPKLSKGGAEIAAFEMFERMANRSGVKTWFLGCQRGHQGARLGSIFTQPFSDREYLYASGAFDWFKFANPDPNLPREFRALLTELRPDIVHFHHFINFGVEMFAHVKSALPDAKIVLTLHEYLAICNHFGQMITTERRTLCYEAGPRRCSACFPERSAADFFLRNLYITRFFDHVDLFIAPSRFLAERFIAWGLPTDRIAVIENVIRPNPALPVPAVPHTPMRIGFFGQISYLKGIDVLFEAAHILHADDISGVSFEIFGDYRGQPDEFQAEFLASLAKASRNIRFNGPYDQNNVDRLMSEMDAVIVPSIWWENSPVVIQESLRNHRPVICSDIGGMAEKVRDGLDGFQFRTGSAIALVELVRRLVTDRSLLTGLSKTLGQPPGAEDIVDTHLALYRRLRAAPNRSGADIEAVA